MVKLIFLAAVIFCGGVIAGFELGYRFYDKKTRDFYKDQNRRKK